MNSNNFSSLENKSMEPKINIALRSVLLMIAVPSLLGIVFGLIWFLLAGVVLQSLKDSHRLFEIDLVFFVLSIIVGITGGFFANKRIQQDSLRNFDIIEQCNQKEYPQGFVDDDEIEIDRYEKRFYQYSLLGFFLAILGSVLGAFLAMTVGHFMGLYFCMSATVETMNGPYTIDFGLRSGGLLAVFPTITALTLFIINFINYYKLSRK